MKKDPSSGIDIMPGPSISFFFGSGYKSVYVVHHNLKYTPLFRVYYEPYIDNKVMEGFQDTAWFLPDTPNDIRLTPVAPTLIAWADDDNLYIELNFTDATLAGNNYPIYWTIYKDFGL